MNHSGQNTVINTDPLLPQSELCEVCAGKDDEDLYIVFNALYRVIVGEVFYQGFETLDKEFNLNSLCVNFNHQQQKDFKTSQEKLQLFRKKLSSQALLDLVALPRFDLLLREIFKSKYNRVQDTSCKHQELAMNFIRNFNLKNDEFFENSDLSKKRLMENTEKLDVLYNKIKQLKSEIESYHNEIDNLSERIVKKLLPNNSHFITKKLQIHDDDRDNSDDQGSDVFDTYVDKKNSNSNDGAHCNASTGSSEGSSSGSTYGYEKSVEVTPTEKHERKHKKSKTATFKSKLPKKATDVLKGWFLNNIQNPYPSHEAKEALSKMTGLTRKQIQNWFTNSRKRFLEPLKKKIEGQKPSKDGSIIFDRVQDIFSSESHSEVDLADSVAQSVVQEPIIFSQSTSQNKPSSKSDVSFNSTLPNTNENVPKNVLKTPPQVSPQTQLGAFSNSLQSPLQSNGNNLVMLPWVLPQTVYPYRPTYPNLLSLNTPSMMPLSQGNFPVNPSLLDTQLAIHNQFGFPIQPSLMDINGIVNQQIPSNFNALNMNLLNSVNHPGSVGQLLSQDRISYLNKMSPFMTQPGANVDQLFYKSASETLHRNSSSLYHPRPEMPELDYLGPKYVHRDPYSRLI